MKKITFAFIALMTVAITVSAADYVIYSKNCDGKTNYWYDRTTGDNKSCGCPCGSAQWMGIKGEYNTPLEGEIWYTFEAEDGQYEVTFVYKGDSDGKAPYKIFVDGAEIGSGKVGHSSGSKSFGPATINNGDEIRIWAKSDYSDNNTSPINGQGKHGNYCRWNRLEFNRTGDGGGSGDGGGDDPTAPEQVSGLKTTSVTATEISLDWNQSADADGYKIYWTNINDPDDQTSNTSYTISNLSPDTEYTIWIKAYNSAGDADGTSITVTTDADGGGGNTEPAGSPEKVTGLDTASVSQTEIALSWDESTNASGYEIYWTNVHNPDDQTAETSYTITGLQPATEYSIWVKAFNANEKARGTNIVVITRDQALTGSPIASVSLPQPDATYAVGDELEIVWQPNSGYESIGLVIDLSLDNQRTWVRISPDEGSVPNSQGEFRWVIPSAIQKFNAATAKYEDIPVTTTDGYIMLYEYDGQTDPTLVGPITISGTATTVVLPHKPASAVVIPRKTLAGIGSRTATNRQAPAVRYDLLGRTTKTAKPAKALSAENRGASGVRISE